MFGDAHGLATTLGGRESGINDTFPFVDRSFVAQRGGQLGQHFVQNVLLTPLLETAIDRPLATYNRKSTLNVRSHRIECLVHTAHIKMIASIRIGVLVEQLLSSVQRL